MAAKSILLPYNFTAADQKAIDFVNRTFAAFESAEITVFHVYTPVPQIETLETTVLSKLKSNLAYLSQKIKEQEAELEAVRQRLEAGGFARKHVQTVFRARKKDVAAEIIELASGGRFDVLVISRKPGKATRFFTGSVSTKVISALKDITICIVS